MNKKKLSTLLLAGVLAVGAVGGSFAWFTSNDIATNKFATPGGSDPGEEGDAGAGIEIWENFDKETAADVTPGGDVNKDVQFKSDVTYDQFLRVKITPQWTHLLNAELPAEPVKSEHLTLTYINLAADLEAAKNGQWILGPDNYYYYIGVVPANGYTTQLLDTVTLEGTADNSYKNGKFDVKVDVETIQATNGAVETWKTTGINENIIAKLMSMGVDKNTIEANRVNGTVILDAVQVSGDVNHN